jgi:tRNA G26 N,N-dimethylase Trm1
MVRVCEILQPVKSPAFHNTFELTIQQKETPRSCEQLITLSYTSKTLDNIKSGSEIYKSTNCTRTEEKVHCWSPLFVGKQQDLAVAVTLAYRPGSKRRTNYSLWQQIGKVDQRAKTGIRNSKWILKVNSKDIATSFISNSTTGSQLGVLGTKVRNKTS